MPAGQAGPVVEAVLRYNAMAGWGVLVVSLLLVLCAVPTFLLVCGRQVVLLFLFLALLPVVIGLGGSVLGLRAALTAVAEAGEAVGPTEMDAAKRLAMGTTLMGVLFSGLLWVAGLVVLALRRPSPRHGPGGP